MNSSYQGAAFAEPIKLFFVNYGGNTRPSAQWASFARRLVGPKLVGSKPTIVNLSQPQHILMPYLTISSLSGRRLH